MKFLSLIVVVASSCALLQLALCQDSPPQCRDLAVENDGAAMPGSGLTFCRNNSAQCCLQSHIDAVTEVARNRLGLGLRLQMRETSLTFNRTIDMIKNYFTMHFRDSFIGSLPMFNGVVNFEQLNATAGTVIMGFVQNLQTANVSRFISDVNSAIAGAAAQLLSGGNQDVQMCVRQFIINSVNQNDIAILIRGLMTVQRALNSLDRIADFLYRYRMNTMFRFPQDCVRRFVELNFCARCTRRIPPLCSNTCGALFRGCLSPYYTVLSRQFDLLFNVSRQVLRVTNNTLQTLFTNERNLINIVQVASQLASQCPGAQFPGSQSGKRQAPTPNTRVMFIPQERMRELRNLDGRGFTYDNTAGGRGPIICRPSTEEVAFCTNPRMRGSDESDYCNATVDCTSSCRCFDGMNPRMTNTDEFTMNGIDGQANNPAITLMESELMSVVADIGSPASSFLMQDTFTSTIPDGVVLPSDDNGSGSVRTAISIMALLLAVITAMLV